MSCHYVFLVEYIFIHFWLNCYEHLLRTFALPNKLSYGGFSNSHWKMVVWFFFNCQLRSDSPNWDFLSLSSFQAVSADSVADQNKQKVRWIWKQQQLHGGHKINSRMWSKFIFQWQSKNIQQNLKKKLRISVSRSIPSGKHSGSS